MKKILLLLAVLIFSFNAFSQSKVKIGLRVAPGLSFNTVQDKSGTDSSAFSKNGAGFAFSGGLNFDFMVSDNYSISTGLWYTTRRAGLKVASTQKDGSVSTFTEAVALQYVQVPLALKLYTNEIATNMKLYFQVGGTLDIKIAEKLKNSSDAAYSGSYKSTFLPLNVGILAGAGAEYQTGGNIILFAGLFYNRGLLNQVRNTDYFKYRDYLKYNNSNLSLEFGAKF
jgi:hypothetical protein